MCYDVHMSELHTTTAVRIRERIRDARLAAGLTQTELADRCELTQGAISQIENGDGSPRVTTLIRIAEALNVPLHTLISEASQVQ
jgi:transcriptional regulator with XRE-family HTH domain